MTRRLLQKSIQRLDALLIESQANQRLTQNDLCRTCLRLTFGDRDLSFVSCLVVILLPQVAIGKQVMRKPVFGIGRHRLLQRRPRRNIILAFQARPSQQRQGLCIVGTQGCGRSQVIRCLLEVFLLEIQISQQEIEVGAGWSRLVSLVELLLRIAELAGLQR